MVIFDCKSVTLLNFWNKRRTGVQQVGGDSRASKRDGIRAFATPNFASSDEQIKLKEIYCIRFRTRKQVSNDTGKLPPIFREFMSNKVHKNQKSRKIWRDGNSGEKVSMGWAFFIFRKRFQQFYRFFRSEWSVPPLLQASCRTRKEGGPANILIWRHHCVVNNGTPVRTSLNIARTNK